MPDFAQPADIFTTSYTYIIYQDGAVVKARNNKTGVITSNANIDPLITTILASADPNFEVQSGTYNLSGGFTGWDVPINMHAYLHINTKIYVPSGYTGAVWKFSPVADIVYYATLDGGYYDEQGTKSNNWTCVQIKPTGSGGAVYSCVIKNMRIWCCKYPIHINTNGTGNTWANQNEFINIYAEACKYLIWFEHTGTYTVNVNGPLGNIFTDVSCQAADGSVPGQAQILGGIMNVLGQWNTFIHCNTWDFFVNAAAPTMTIGANANGTRIIGGFVKEYLFTDSGTYTTSDDYYGGLSIKNQANFYGRSGGYPAINVARLAEGGYEPVASFGINGSTDVFTVENGSAASAAFAGFWRATFTSANAEDWQEAMHIQSVVRNDSDDIPSVYPCTIISAKTATTTFAIVNRPILAIANYTTNKYLFYPTKFDMTGNSLVNAVIPALKTGYLSVTTTPVTLSATADQLVKVDASGGARTVNLPAASGNSGLWYNIIKSDSSANNVTIDGNASETINGATTYLLTTQYQSIILRCDGANWFTQPNTSERTGKAVASGNGSTTLFNIAHGLGTTPSNAMISVAKPAVATTYTIDSTNIAVTFVSAPASASNNVEIHWRVVT